MELTQDYIQRTPNGGRCRVRIYQDGDDVPVIVCTELPDNPGMSITNAAEIVAARVLERHPDVFGTYGLCLDPSQKIPATHPPFVWVEHYLDGARGAPSDPATFDLTTFSHYDVRGGRIGAPSWKALDRVTVEALVGAHVD